jgi:hypothetical protein
MGEGVFEIHPLAELIPSMTPEEFADLRADIEANGLLSSITVFEDKILDGRHRYRACAELGVEPRFEDFEGEEPARFVISLNLKRRNLSKSQLAMTAAEFLPALEAEARKKQVEAGKNFGRGMDSSVQNRAELSDEGRSARDGRAASEAAALTGASARYVSAAKRVAEVDPVLAEKVKTGDVSLDAAEKQVADRSPRDNGLDTKTGSTGRQQPATYFGKGDKWQEATEPLVRYLRGQKSRDFDFSHLNWKEAKKRVQRIDELVADLQAARADLEPRSHKAKLRF